MATATVAAGAASGLRAWAAARRPGWLTKGRLKRLTGALLGAALAISAVGIA